jgi:hypothetical protein
MARFPKIDSPCPLSLEAQARIEGHCGRCDKTVHALDDMDDAARTALLRNANGPVCVSYRLKAGLGAALALSMSSPLLAQDRAADPVPLPQTRSTGAEPSEQTSVAPPPALVDKLDRIVFTGGVRDPAEAEWVDEDDVPELPMVRDAPAD